MDLNNALHSSPGYTYDISRVMYLHSAFPV